MRLNKIIKLLAKALIVEIFNADAALDDCGLYDGKVMNIPGQLRKCKVVAIYPVGCNKMNIYIKL